MLDRRHRELISAGIDGELTPREQAELDELLAASDEARALHTELLAVGGLLDSLPRVAPPPELAERVLSRAAPRSGNWPASGAGCCTPKSQAVTMISSRSEDIRCWRRDL